MGLILESLTWPEIWMSHKDGYNCFEYKKKTNSIGQLRAEIAYFIRIVHKLYVNYVDKW